MENKKNLKKRTKHPQPDATGGNPDDGKRMMSEGRQINLQRALKQEGKLDGELGESEVNTEA